MLQIRIKKKNTLNDMVQMSVLHGRSLQCQHAVPVRGNHLAGWWEKEVRTEPSFCNNKWNNKRISSMRCHIGIKVYRMNSLVTRCSRERISFRVAALKFSEILFSSSTEHVFWCSVGFGYKNRSHISTGLLPTSPSPLSCRGVLSW